MTSKLNSKYARYVEAYEAIFNADIPMSGFDRSTGNWKIEAEKYGADFYLHDENCSFDLGCTDWTTSRAAVFAVEAIRLLNVGSDGIPGAVQLLQLAIEEIKREAKYPGTVPSSTSAAEQPA